MLTRRTVAWALATVACMSACGGDGGKKGNPARDAGAQSQQDGQVPQDGGMEPQPGQIKFSGHVLDAETNSPINGALIRAGGAQATTKTDGLFSLLFGSTDDALALELSQKLYAGTELEVPKDGGDAQLFMKKLDATHKFKAEDGISVDLPSGVKIDIPPDSVVDSKGVKVKGAMTLEVAVVDGRDTKEASALPSKKDAITKDGKHGVLSVEHGLSMRITDIDGKEMSVDRKSKVQASIPASEKDVDAQLAVYSYSENTKAWGEEGSAKRSADDKYVADIEHLSWWSLGHFLPTRSCVRACVEDASGARVKGAQVWVVGTSAPGVGTFFTDETGCGAGDTAGDLDVTVIAQSGDRVSSRVQLHVPSVAASAEENPDSCEDAGRLALTGKKTNACALCSVGQPDLGQHDAGTMMPDAGHITVDAGGNDVPDAGSVVHDSGMSIPDAGSSTQDAGSVAMDSGTSVPDAGSSNDAAVMTDGGASALDAGAIACSAGYDECDNNPATVCETSLNQVTSCGTCTTVCSTANGTPACANENCTVQSCNQGYADCDLLANTGCESQLSSDATNCGTCGRDCSAAGTTCTQSMCDALPLFTNQPYGTDNSAARTWVFSGGAAYHLGFNSYSLDQLPVGGGSPKQIWTSSATGGTESLAVTATDVYWAERGTPSVMLTKPLSAASSTLPTVAFTPVGQPIFVRIMGGNFYWATGDYQASDTTGYIYSRALNAPSSDPGTQIVSADQGYWLSMVALAVTTDAIYWVTSTDSYGIRTTPLTGGTPAEVPGGAIVNGSATGTATLKTQGATLYFNRNVDTSYLNGIYSYNAGDAQPKQVVSAEDVTSFVLDTNFVYFLRQNVNGVFKAPITGGQATQIAAQSATLLVGVDSTYVYLTNSGCCATALLAVVK